MRAIAIAAVLLVASAASADVPCSVPSKELFRKILNEGMPVTLDGGIVIAEESLPGTGKQDEPAAPKLAFKSTGGLAQPSVSVLAPGLVRYGLPAGVLEADLMDGDAEKSHTKIDKNVAALAAPVLKAARIILLDKKGDRSELVELAVGPAPEGAIAAVMFDGKGEKALAFSTGVGKGDTNVSYWQSSRCRRIPAGTGVVKVGGAVTVRWVDAWGRLSPISKPTKIAKVVKNPF